MKSYSYYSCNFTEIKLHYKCFILEFFVKVFYDSYSTEILNSRTSLRQAVDMPQSG